MGFVDLPDPQFSPPEHPAPLADYLLTGGVFSPDGQRLAAIQCFGGMSVIDLTDGKEIYHVLDAKQVIISPDGLTLAITKNDGDVVVKRINGLKMNRATANSSICLLDHGTGKERTRIDLPGTGVWAMAFSPDGKTLAATTGWEEGQIHFYETSTGKETRTITAPPIRTSGLAFTPDGSRIVTGMADTSVLIWNLRANAE
jgi:WD40 repeat protein